MIARWMWVSIWLGGAASFLLTSSSWANQVSVRVNQYDDLMLFHLLIRLWLKMIWYWRDHISFYNVVVLFFFNFCLSNLSGHRQVFMGLRVVNYSSTSKEKHVVVQLCLLVVSSWDNQIKTPRTSLTRTSVITPFLLFTHISQVIPYLTLCKVFLIKVRDEALRAN